MKYSPILFSGPMVRALPRKVNPKTQTRRVVKLNGRFLKDERGRDIFEKLSGSGPFVEADGKVYVMEQDGELDMPEEFCPYGQPGDRLWVRETHFLYGYWQDMSAGEHGRYNDDPTWKFFPDQKKGVLFPDDPPAIIAQRMDVIGWFKRPSIFLPRWASRTELEVTDVRVQRLQDISEEDAKAEGVERMDAVAWKSYHPAIRGSIRNKRTGENACRTAKESFCQLWDSINAARGHGWDKNDFVWALNFKRLK